MVAMEPGVVPMTWDNNLALRTVVLGVPKPQGSVKAFAAKGRAYVTSNHSTDFVVWRNSVIEKCERIWDQPPAEAAWVELQFRLPVPKSQPKYLENWAPHTKRPDIDKLSRAVLDALVAAGVLADDSVVHSLNVTKRYALREQPGCSIEVQPTHIPESPRKRRDT